MKYKQASKLKQYAKLATKCVGKKNCDEQTSRLRSTLTTTSGSRKWKCAYCTLAFKGDPVGCPVDKITDYKADDSGSFVTTGCFCCLRCAKAYALERYDRPTFKDSCRYIDEINQFRRVVPAPDIFLMSSFGGPLTDSQYRELLRDARRVIRLESRTRQFPVTLNYVDTNALKT